MELIEAAAYYERHVSGLGERFQSEVRRIVDLLLSQPQIGALVDQIFASSSSPASHLPCITHHGGCEGKMFGATDGTSFIPMIDL